MFIMSSSQNLLLKLVFSTFLFLINRFVNSEDVCLLPRKAGFCRGMVPRWYYNSGTGKCEKFFWGGCPMGSNGNRFEYQYQCNNMCQALSCSKRYQAMGCYTNYQSVSAKQPEKELLNERDMKSKAFNGTLIDWLFWTNYLPGMLCRCAKRAASNGYGIFTIHNLGECWGMKENQANMPNKTEQCWDRFYGQQCSSSADLCAGGPSAYYYYKLT